MVAMTLATDTHTGLDEREGMIIRGGVAPSDGHRIDAAVAMRPWPKKATTDDG